MHLEDGVPLIDAATLVGNVISTKSVVLSESAFLVITAPLVGTVNASLANFKICIYLDLGRTIRRTNRPIFFV